MAMADQPTFSTGAMLALYPDEETAAALAVDGGLPVDELHVTVAYLGKARNLSRGAMLGAATQVIRDRPEIQATISGHARFTGGEDGDVAVLLVDSPELEQLRRDLVDALRREGIEPVLNHGYTAHMTQAYIAADAPAPVDRVEPLPVTFTALSVVHGDDRTDLPFVGLRPRSVAELAREAYAQGWAASGGPMTERVRAGCVAAVEFAEQHADDPGVLEATLHLGHLEGLWATIFERRDKLHARNIEAILTVLRPMVADLDLPTLIRRVRHEEGLRESITEASAGALVDLVLNWLRQLLHRTAWKELRAEVADAIVRGQAEGQADAIALAAEHYQVTIDFNLAFEEAYKALEDVPGLMDEADRWLARMVGDQASELGALLGRMTRDGAGYDDMLAAAEDLLSSGKLRAVSVVIDQLTARALSAGALDLYASEGVTKVDFLTAGDARVCVVCEDLEKNNPYPVADAPQPSIHPYCRCTVAAVTPLRRDLIAKYVT